MWKRRNWEWEKKWCENIYRRERVMSDAAATWSYLCTFMLFVSSSRFFLHLSANIPHPFLYPTRFFIHCLYDVIAHLFYTKFQVDLILFFTFFFIFYFYCPSTLLTHTKKKLHSERIETREWWSSDKYFIMYIKVKMRKTMQISNSKSHILIFL